jgi:uridine kinase
MLIVGIAGGTGSGKTTVVRKITEVFPNGEVIVMPQDSYYRDNRGIPLEERQKINFDHPDSVEFSLLIEHLKELRKGKTIEMPIYSYLTCLRSEETVSIKPSRVVVVDRLGRVIQRDIIERGRTVLKVLERYHDTVKPSHLQFIEPSKRYADIIIPGGGENQVGIEVLISIVEKHLLKS